MTKRKTKQYDHIKEAAMAFSDLDAFAHIEVICERLHTSSFSGASRIIKICHREQMKRLHEYDTAVKRAGGGTYLDPK